MKRSEFLKILGITPIVAPLIKPTLEEIPEEPKKVIEDKPVYVKKENSGFIDFFPKIQFLDKGEIIATGNLTDVSYSVPQYRIHANLLIVQFSKREMEINMHKLRQRFENNVLMGFKAYHKDNDTTCEGEVFCQTIQAEVTEEGIWCTSEFIINGAVTIV